MDSGETLQVLCLLLIYILLWEKPNLCSIIVEVIRDSSNYLWGWVNPTVRKISFFVLVIRKLNTILRGF